MRTYQNENSLSKRNLRERSANKNGLEGLRRVRGCLKIEISFHFVILNVVKDLENTS